MLFFFGAGHLTHSHPTCLGAAPAFCAGTFLCIACMGLLPEVQFHSHDRIKLSLALLAGIGVAVLIARYGHAGHEHQHSAWRDRSSNGPMIAKLETRHCVDCQHTSRVGA